MASKSGNKVNYKSAQKSNDCINELPSGLIHTADSQGSTDPAGQFISHFGPPGEPTETPHFDKDITYSEHGGGKPGNPYTELMLGKNSTKRRG